MTRACLQAVAALDECVSEDAVQGIAAREARAQINAEETHRCKREDARLQVRCIVQRHAQTRHCSPAAALPRRTALVLVVLAARR
jgi:hypothetical protein